MTQEKERRFRFLDYAPPIVAFIAAIAAVVGSPKWDTAAPGVAKITLLWLARIGDRSARAGYVIAGDLAQQARVGAAARNKGPHCIDWHAPVVEGVPACGPSYCQRLDLEAAVRRA